MVPNFMLLVNTQLAGFDSSTNRDMVSCSPEHTTESIILSL